jgi:hypothetical protein
MSTTVAVLPLFDADAIAEACLGVSAQVDLAIRRFRAAVAGLTKIAHQRARYADETALAMKRYVPILFRDLGLTPQAMSAEEYDEASGLRRRQQSTYPGSVRGFAKQERQAELAARRGRRKSPDRKEAAE